MTFAAFCLAVGLDLEPFQRKIVAAIDGGHTETLVLLPRGNGKSTLLGAYAVWHLLTVRHAAIYVAASSRDQARVIFEYARAFAMENAAISARITVRHLELRCDDGGFLRVLASDAPKLHGLTPSLVIVDELHAFKDQEVYVALRTAMMKRPGARMVVVTTAGQGAGSPLGRLRARALGLPSVTRRGALTKAVGPDLVMLEWSVPDEIRTSDMAWAKRANPASWLSRTALRKQRDAVPDLAFQRYHLNRWTAREGSWLPPGAWQACIGVPEFEDGQDVWVGVDIGGVRAATAVVWINEDRHVGASIYHGDDGVFEATARIRELADTYNVREIAFDPWRFKVPALELESAGLCAVEFNQTDARMAPASSALYEAIVHRELTLPDHEELTSHSAHAVARHSRRGWRIDKAEDSAQIDGLIALAMALDRATHKAPEAALIGWI